MQFIDLAAQQERIGDKIKSRIHEVLSHGKYIMGPEVKELEDGLRNYVGVNHALGCANGTDALQLVLMAWGIGPGDAVFVPSFTFASTAEVVALVGATPVFVEIDEFTFNMDAACLESAIKSVIQQGELQPKVVIPVDLFGLPANYQAILPVCEEYGLRVIEDGAQGLGGERNGVKAGAFGHAATTSFFPAKPLGCYGDGGAIFTQDDELASVLESLRVHGKGYDKYDNVRVGLNSRLDTLQAAILIPKLEVFPQEVIDRNRVAARYSEAFANHAGIRVPHVPAGAISSWAQYTLVVEDRARLMKILAEKGIPTAVYYGKPLHMQTAYKDNPVQPGGLLLTERLSDQVLSIPMHPYLDEKTQDYIIEGVFDALKKSA
ncbi:DegT/DnrJ/EryC1/StrS family aminotransferase [Pseudorhizobium halotolerans]|uniref:DegT/DnrJ/EryC1/StrS family aminotransferase n=1 Tax=Pseudorhizobium halotolerans TaxID=1233081 RepID=UPI00115B26A9|nr:DegT/DnrJ/EryC1/StrS aminotransferase family protein [Pseudorhizobium halotolerans]